MTIPEVLKELKSELKPYIGVMPQSTFSNRIKRIEDGTAKQKTIAELFNKFGYQGSFNEWIKRQDQEA